MYDKLTEDQLKNGKVLVDKEADRNPDVDRNPDIVSQYVARIIASRVGRGGRTVFTLSGGRMWETRDLLRGFRSASPREASLIGIAEPPQ